MVTRPRAQTNTKLEGLIILTLLKLKNRGLSESSLYSTSQKLRHLDKNTNLLNPEDVKTYIANKNIAGSSKQKLANIYDQFCKINNIEWQKPRYKYERKIPLIPTTANIDKVISASSQKYATIFTILKETGIEGRELATTHRNDIDVEQGIINVQGCKGHNSRSIKLKSKTADMLRAYLDIHKEEKPFPKSKRMGERWRRIRNRLADKLNEDQLKAIPLRNLRHYYATRLYDKTKDILLVKQRLGHKKIETTMFYTQLITFTEDEEYTCKTASNIKEATDLIEHGFEYITEMEGIKIFRKRK